MSDGATLAVVTVRVAGLLVTEPALPLVKEGSVSVCGDGKGRGLSSGHHLAGRLGFDHGHLIGGGACYSNAARVKQHRRHAEHEDKERKWLTRNSLGFELERASPIRICNP